MADTRSNQIRTPSHKTGRAASRGKAQTKSKRKGAAGKKTISVVLSSPAGAGSKFPIAIKSYSGVYSASAGTRIEIIKGGVKAGFVSQLAEAMDTSKEALLSHLGLARATVDRKIREDKPLSQDEAQRVIGMAKLIGLVETMAERTTGGEDFEAAKWLAKWVEQPLPALGGRKPAEYLDTAEGQELVANTLQRMESGAYS
jgi:putative toxin-antitoxin system antitoxin component (TIGR02293 family)